jgi:polyisoprenoid-binding protein YceI
MRKLVYLAGGLVALVAIVVVAAFVITRLRSDDPNLATEAPQLPTAAAGAAVGTTPASGTGGGTANPPQTPAPGVLRFVIDPAQSSAKYVVQETLRGLEATAVGETKDISGEIHLTRTGLASTPSTIRVDLSTLRSDESMRDNFIRTSTLQSNQPQNRYAEFTIANVTGFPASYVEGQEVALTLSGTMKIRGIEKPVTWQVRARQAGNLLSATADTDFNMTDFGITPPTVPFARARDSVHIQVVFVARQAT